MYMVVEFERTLEFGETLKKTVLGQMREKKRDIPGGKRRNRHQRPAERFRMKKFKSNQSIDEQGKDLDR